VSIIERMPRLHGWLIERGWLGMSAADRAAWWGAGSFEELGECVARWLEGEIISRPGCMPRYGPDPETTELIPILARVNRRGFVTDGSQPGVTEHLDDDDACPQHRGGGLYEQRAAVEGWGDETMRDRLQALAHEHGLMFIAHQPRWRFDGHTAVCVSRTTTILGLTQEHTGFGATRSRREVKTLGWDGLNPAMHQQMVTGWNITLIDPEWGPSDRLWRALAEL
jgi:hypothetical protein